MEKPETAAPGVTRLAYLNCNNATVLVADANLSPAESSKLSAVVACLEQSAGLLRPAETAQPSAPLDLGGVIAMLRASFGSAAVDAALAGGRKGAPRAGARPAAVMPIFALAPEGGDPDDRDVLAGSARLWGAELQMELLRVDGPRTRAPVPATRPRYRRWHDAAGGGSDRSAVQPPGEAGWYAVTAISAPV